MIFGLLRVEYERLLVIVKLDQAAPLAGDDKAGHGVLVFGKHGDLKQHRRDEVDGLECLEVDRHVCGQQSTLLLDLLLRGLLVVATIDALGEELAEARVLEDLNEDFMRLLNFTQPKVGHTNLGDGSIVKDLVVNVLQRDDFADVRLLEQVFGDDDIVVQGQVVHLEESRLDSHLGLAVLLHQLDNIFDFRGGILKEVDA